MSRAPPLLRKQDYSFFQAKAKHAVQTQAKRAVQAQAKRAVQAQAKRAVHAQAKRAVHAQTKRPTQADSAVQTQAESAVQTQAKSAALFICSASPVYFSNSVSGFSVRSIFGRVFFLGTTFQFTTTESTEQFFLICRSITMWTGETRCPAITRHGFGLL